MRAKAVSMAVLAFIVVLLLGASAEAQLAKQGKYTGTFGWWAVGTAHEVEKGHIFWLGEFNGVFQNAVRGGFIDMTSVVCPGVNDLVDGVSKANHGYCVVTDGAGDKAFLVWSGEGSGQGKGGGTFQWTGGTGKFAAIKGDNTYQYTFIGQTGQGISVLDGAWELPR